MKILCRKKTQNTFFSSQILPNQARTAAVTKREALERNISAGMGKFFPDLLQEAEDLSSAVAALHGGNRMVSSQCHYVE
ncbi:putative conjugative transfer protein TraC [Orientia chuto str. Dubai]|uniref:Putative conjugative transfer protein TraC n=1 Tax=Orientia chuto str. Dubai TaxID=1359168 RepID=A0A0F3MNE5_9RICK|nr:putative conjugative transfer protein TraC [Orientia chuto str. Dubai]